MKTLFNLRRRVTSLVLAVFAVTALSPAAHAEHRWRRYKGEPSYGRPPVRHVHYAPRRVVYFERHSDAVPLFAGLIGGLVIGSALAHASAPAVEPAYYYWDPWCHERFASLAIYRSHFYHHHHPRVVRVISVETGDCMDTYCWHDGDWRSEPGDGWDQDGGWDHSEDRDE